MRVLFSALALLAVAGCSGATFDDVYDRPDALDWTYFEASSYDVTEALEEALETNDIRVEGKRVEDGGTILTLTRGGASPQISEIRIEAVQVEDYRARAQVYPDRDPLPRWIEIEVSGRL